MPSVYEAHNHPDPNFPIIFRQDRAAKTLESGSLHWHEALEIIYCVEGSGTAVSDLDRIPMEQGEIVVINSNRLHSFYSGGYCKYYFLIVAPAFFEGLNLPIEESPLQQCIRDVEIVSLFRSLIAEMEEKAPYYQSAMRADIYKLYVLLFRRYAGEPEPAVGKRANNRLDMVKEAVAYIRRTYTQEITIDDICAHVGFSKYYVCHAFHEITGRTIVGHINFLRCCNARNLLATGRYNISESAEQSGFRNMSYFARTYKKLMGTLPSGK